jgi:hypothetical protein
VVKVSEMKTSALERVLNFRRSLTRGLNETNKPEAEHEQDPPMDIVPEAATAKSPDLSRIAAAAEAAMSAATLLSREEQPEGAAGVTERPGSAEEMTLPLEAPTIAQVTVVPTEAHVQAVAGHTEHKAMMSNAIDAIEADIASILAGLDTPHDAPRKSPVAAAANDDDDDDAFEAFNSPLDDLDESEDVAGDAETATKVLLADLDRMWRADPTVGLVR